MQGAVPFIQLDTLCKSFGRVRANHNISLDIHAGKILALLGENGAGKSTLMSLLAGQLQPDSGRILLNGRQVVLSSTEKAIQCGIGMVYQHFKLVEAMNVLENIVLGQSQGFWLKRSALKRQIAELARAYGIPLALNARVSTLSMGEKQQVEILKLLFRKSDLLIFDEPTSVLTPAEATNLFTTMREMAAQGKAIVFISHKLEEVLCIADHIAILKQGEIIDQLSPAADLVPAELARRMVGRPVLLQVEREELEPRQTVLKVQGLGGNGLEQVDLELRQGELLSLVGVAGNGQKALVENICGLLPPKEGAVRILGQDWADFYAARQTETSLSYIPEDRQGLATCPGLDLLDNFLLTTRHAFSKGPWLDKNTAKDKLDKLLQDFAIRPQDSSTHAWQLSGGNLQKLVLAREFYRKPRLIVAEQPTQGLDIAAAEEVWRLLLQAREQAGILLVTGDLAEALALSDRIGVMFRGQLVAIMARHDHESIARIPQMMAGLALSEGESQKTYNQGVES